MRTQTYPSDVTDEQWALIEPHIPVYPGGRPRKTHTRTVVGAQAAAELFGRWVGQPRGKVVRMYGDNKYHNYALYQWVEENAHWNLVIVRRPKGAGGWVRLPIRWTVERTFAWLGRCRRLSL